MVHIRFGSLSSFVPRIRGHFHRSSSASENRGEVGKSPTEARCVCKLRQALRADNKESKRSKKGSSLRRASNPCDRDFVKEGMCQSRAAKVSGLFRIIYRYERVTKQHSCHIRFDTSSTSPRCGMFGRLPEQSGQIINGDHKEENERIALFATGSSPRARPVSRRSSKV